MKKSFLTTLLVLVAAALAYAQPPNDRVQTGTVTSTTCPGTGCVNVSVAGGGTLGVAVTGTWSATLQFEAAVDNVPTFAALNAYPLPVSGVPVTSTTANGTWLIPVAGYSNVRVRASAYTSGTATITLRLNVGQTLVVAVQPTAGNMNVTAAAGTNLNTSALALNTSVDGLETNTTDLLTNAGFNAAFGTAGTADSQVMSVQGIASMTPLQVQSNAASLATETTLGTRLADSTYTGRTPAGASPADNESNTNTALSRRGAYLFCFDGTAWDRCPGTTVDGLLVNLGANNDVTIPANSSVNLNQVVGAAPGATNPVPSRLTDGTAFYDARTITSFPDNEPVNVAQRGGVAVVAGPCEREVVLFAVIDQTSGEQIVTGTASERIYICSLQLISATAQNVALVDGTGSVCATSPTGLLGGSTAATGWNFAANGGLVLPNNDVSWAKTSTDADNVCLLQSSSGQISGSITYVSIPNI